MTAIDFARVGGLTDRGDGQPVAEASDSDDEDAASGRLPRVTHDHLVRRATDPGARPGRPPRALLPCALPGCPA
jgi:hypothetical protein